LCRAHLVEVEDGYTQELMVGDEREQELRKQVARLEDQVTTFDHKYLILVLTRSAERSFARIRIILGSRIRICIKVKIPVLRIRDVFPGSRILIFTHP
jgi:hypothetical protein